MLSKGGSEKKLNSVLCICFKNMKDNLELNVRSTCEILSPASFSSALQLASACCLRAKRPKNTTTSQRRFLAPTRQCSPTLPVTLWHRALFSTVRYFLSRIFTSQKKCFSQTALQGPYGALLAPHLETASVDNVLLTLHKSLPMNQTKCKPEKHSKTIKTGGW